VNGVTDNAGLHRYELVENGLTAFTDYHRHGETVILRHVEAPVALRGKGTAGRMMEGIVALTRAQGLKIVPSCPYAVVWFRRHPEAADLLRG
jgi:uncharacterized protein